MGEIKIGKVDNNGKVLEVFRALCPIHDECKKYVNIKVYSINSRLIRVVLSASEEIKNIATLKMDFISKIKSIVEQATGKPYYATGYLVGETILIDKEEYGWIQTWRY
jgi:hypothetical protein